MRITFVQLFFNFFWSIIFFNMRMFFFSFLWIVALWTLVLLMVSKFRKVDFWAGVLNIPYLLWVTFATYLNFAVYILNWLNPDSHQCYFLFFNLTFHNKFCIKLNFHSPPSLWRSGEICTFVRIFFKTCPFPFLSWKTYSILTEFTVEIRGHINVHKHYNI